MVFVLMHCKRRNVALTNHTLVTLVASQCIDTVIGNQGIYPTEQLMYHRTPKGNTLGQASGN